MNIEKLHHLFLNSKGITTDTRSIKSNQIFFALKGDNFNGNSFAWQALKKGATHAIIDEDQFAKDERYIVVKDVLQCLQELAKYHRKYLKIPILAITGSNGKTTTKELIHTVLKRKFNTIATVGNLNNHIGVPLTLLTMNDTTEFGIVEMGANHHKEIKNLAGIANPDYGYITNFGKAHLEGFGSVEGVIKAKSELYDHLKENNKLIFINADDPVQAIHSAYANTFSFGSTMPADIKIEYPENTTAQVICNGISYTSNLTGTYNSYNIAAAVSIGKYFKVPEDGILKAISAYKPQNNRSQIVRVGDLTILMDAYNANPTSMTAALNSFNKYPANKKTVILGDMFELGATSAEEHQDLTSLAENLDFENIFLVGKNFSLVNTTGPGTKKFRNFDDLAEEVAKTDFGNSHLLIKGSRGMAMERILDILREKN